MKFPIRNTLYHLTQFKCEICTIFIQIRAVVNQIKQFHSLWGWFLFEYSAFIGIDTEIRKLCMYNLKIMCHSGKLSKLSVTRNIWESVRARVHVRNQFRNSHFAYHTHACISSALLTLSNRILFLLLYTSTK